MNTPREDDFRDAYAAYERNHVKHRDVMIAALPRISPVVRRLRWLPAVAAVVLVVGLGAASFLSIRATPAYGLDGLRERLQTLRSLHLKGSVFQRTKTEFGVATIRFPVERYYERPSRYFNVGYGFSSNGNDNLTQVTRAFTAADGQRRLTVLHDQKKAILSSNVDPLETELWVENALQASEVEQLISRHPQDFERIGTERLDGVWCDIHQSKAVSDGGVWRRVWINPTNGLPVRVAGFRHGSDGEEELVYEYTEIRANADAPPELFSFQVPEGYQATEVNEAEKTRHISPAASGSAGKHNGAEWVGLNIDDRAVLLCWSQWVRDEKMQVFFHDVPLLVLEGAENRLCTEQTLYETMSGDLRWRWSLVRPNDDKPLGTDPLTIRFHDKKDGTVSLGMQPLVFPQARLAEMVEKVQRRSLEGGGDFSAAKSLQQLRDVISKGTAASPQ